jgi:tetratricopeptide (TPR) repeat protein
MLIPLQSFRGFLMGQDHHPSSKFAKGKGTIATPPAALILIYVTLLAAPTPAQSQNLADLSTQGKSALANQQFDQAAKLYEQIVKLDPRSAEAHSNLGFALYMSGNYQPAIAQFQKALALDPRLDHAQILLALTYFDSGDFNRAVPLLEKAYQVRKDDPVVVAHLGLAYLRQNKDDKALAMLTHWAELEPASADALYFKGKASVYVASDAFDQLSKAAPDSYRMFQLRAEMLRQQNLTAAAISEYKKAIAQKPDAAGLHYALGTLYRDANRLDEALAEFNAELKITPNDAMTNYLIGDVYMQQSKLEDAQKYLTQALQLQPGLADAQLDLAKTYHNQEKTAEAVKLLQSVVASDPTREDAHYLLFGLYKEQGRMNEAKKELQIFEDLKKKTADREQKMLRLDSTN